MKTVTVDKVRAAFELCLEIEGCIRRWEKLFSMLIAWEFDRAKQQVKSWKLDGVLNDGAQRVLDEIDQLRVDSKGADRIC